MLQKTVCPFSSAGYCKNKDSCFRQHPIEDCFNSNCKRKGCFKRHRQICRHTNNCRKLKKDNSRDFLHREKEGLQNSSFIHDLQFHVEELQNEIDELKESNECKQMQLDIMNVSICYICEETGKN